MLWHCRTLRTIQNYRLQKYNKYLKSKQSFHNLAVAVFFSNKSTLLALFLERYCLSSPRQRLQCATETYAAQQHHCHIMKME